MRSISFEDRQSIQFTPPPVPIIANYMNLRLILTVKHHVNIEKIN